MIIKQNLTIFVLYVTLLLSTDNIAPAHQLCDRFMIDGVEALRAHIGNLWKNTWNAVRLMRYYWWPIIESLKITELFWLAEAQEGTVVRQDIVVWFNNATSHPFTISMGVPLRSSANSSPSSPTISDQHQIPSGFWNTRTMPQSWLIS